MRTDLLVVGAGPYAYAAAAYARARGIATHVAGAADVLLARPDARRHVPALGPRLAPRRPGEHTFEAYFEDRGLDPADHDPIPIGVFLDHTDWFREQQGFDVDERFVDGADQAERPLRGDPGRRLDDRGRPGAGVPGHPALREPAGVGRPGAARASRSHTVDRVTFDDLAGARVAVIGGRQSAYEWAALLCDHGAASVDVVHRHDTPTLRPGELGVLRPVRRADGRDPRLVALTAGGAEAGDRPGVLGGRPAHPGALAGAAARPGGGHQPTGLRRRRGRPATDPVTLTLSDGTDLEVDHVVLASGYVADLDRVPCLAGVRDRVSVTGRLPGPLARASRPRCRASTLTGFAATRDFGPFYGFTKGCASSARLVVDEMLR